MSLVTRQASLSTGKNSSTWPWGLENLGIWQSAPAMLRCRQEKTRRHGPGDRREILIFNKNTKKSSIFSVSQKIHENSWNPYGFLIKIIIFAKLNENCRGNYDFQQKSSKTCSFHGFLKSLMKILEIPMDFQWKISIFAKLNENSRNNHCFQQKSRKAGSFQGFSKQSMNILEIPMDFEEKSKKIENLMKTTNNHDYDFS